MGSNKNNDIAIILKYGFNSTDLPDAFRNFSNFSGGAS